MDDDGFPIWHLWNPYIQLDTTHESVHDAIVIKCYTCMDEGFIVTDFAPGIGLAGERNCPNCGDGTYTHIY